jgi:hypothetical protein
MTVAELIAKLQTLPSSMPVISMFAEDYEDIGPVVDVVGPNEELPNAVYLVIDDNRS